MAEEPLCNVEIHLEPKQLKQDHFMKREWSITGASAVRSSARAEQTDLLLIFNAFWSSYTMFVVRVSLCDLKNPS